MDEYDSLINDDGEGNVKGDQNEDEYQVLPDPPEIDYIIDNSDEEMVSKSYDQYIGDSVVLPDHKGEKLMGKVRNHIKLNDIRTIEGHYNIIHDKYIYEVNYPDGTMKQLAANKTAENMLSKVDSEGHHYQVSTKVKYHKIYYSDITKINVFIKYSNGNLHWNMKTCGWKILTERKDVSVDWVPLKDLKQSNSVELDEYAVDNEIRDEPDFSWWIKENFHR